MEKKIAQTFNDQIEEILELEERDFIYEALQSYQQEKDISELVEKLKIIVSHPKKMVLFECVRALIPLNHQMAYDAQIPPKAPKKLRVIRLHRGGGEGLGFAVRGGFEYGVGVYVSHVRPDSRAYQQGLRAGDEVVRVNGFSITQAIHEEVLNLIKAKHDLTLKVRSVGMIPYKDSVDGPVRWKYVVPTFSDNNNVVTETGDEFDMNSEQAGRLIHLIINMTETDTLGCKLCGGPNDDPGIFIKSVKPASLAEEVGLRPGDQLLEVNDIPIQGNRYSEALIALKSSMQLHLLIRRPPSKNQRKSHKSEKQDRSWTHTRERVEIVSPTSSTSSADTYEYFVSEPPLPRSRHDLVQQTLEDKRESHVRWQNETGDYPADTEDNTPPPPPRPPRSSSSHHPKTDIQQKEMEKAKREMLQERQIRDVTISVASTKRNQQFSVPPQDHRTSQDETSMYMSSERAPAFRFQKPVLLNPVSKVSEERHKQGSTGEGYEDLRDDNFNPYRMFTNEQIAGRQIELINVTKTGSPLGIVLETPTNHGRIIVKEVYEGGIIHSQGCLHRGDELLMVEWTSLMNLTLDQARSVLDNAFTSSKSVLQLVIAKGNPSPDEEEILPWPDYIPTSNLDDFIDAFDEGNGSGYTTLYNGDVPVTII